MALAGKSDGQRLRSEVAEFAFCRDERGTHGGVRIGTQHENRFVVAGDHGRGLDSRAARHFFGMITHGRNFPNVAPVNVVLIRGVDNFPPVFTGGDIFHFEISRREQLCRAAAYRSGPQVKPAAALPGKHDAIVRGPDELIFGDHFVIDAAAARIGVPNFLAFAGRSVSDANGPRLAFASRTKWKTCLSRRRCEETRFCGCRATMRPGCRYRRLDRDISSDFAAMS